MKQSKTVRNLRIKRVIKDHKSENLVPLVVKKGDTIEGKEKETKLEGWLWCRNEADIFGWVPKSYLEPDVEPKMYQLLQDYSSRELTVKVGDEIIVLIEESSWVWVRTPLGEEGWIPTDNLEDLKARPSSIPDLM